MTACAAGAGDGAQATASAVTAVDPGFAAPADWNVHTIASSPEQGEEPLNVIVTSTSDVPILSIFAALDRVASWKSVEVGTGLFGLFEDECISAETAEVDPGLDATQLVSLRVNGCDGVVESGEAHARMWHEAGGAWLFAVSSEHVCLHGLRPWHCIDDDGYDRARDAFVSDLRVAAASNGWTVDCRAVPRPAGTGLDGVPFEEYATACTVRAD